MKDRCEEHNCKKLACGCDIRSLITSSAYWEQIRAKNNWISELLDENKELKDKLGIPFYDVDTDYSEDAKEEEFDL